MRPALKKYLLALGLMAVCASPFAVFDPVNDDTDLFRNNPNIPAERPNVLILLDNTANWSSGDKFSSEKTALVNTVAALDSSFNVGLMIFTQGGNCATSSTNGGYVRFGIRQLTTANKAALTQVVNDFTDAACGGGPPTLGDQGSAAAAGQALHEAYLYFSGLTSRTGILQVKRDFFGSTVVTAAPASTLQPNAIAALTPNPFSSGTATVYTSPITDACAKNYIIFISNGPFDNGDDSPSSTLFAGSSGLVPNASGGSFSSWADEYAEYLANTGVTVSGANSKVFMYAVEVDPTLTGQGPDHTNLLKSMATRGKGKYFGLTSANAGVAITEALLAIFTEIQAVNSVFAASTLPVSVNVRGTNLNQLYIGVFRPDATDQPRWLGNLKAYQLRRDSVTNTVFTVDANLNPAINSSTGFITSNAKSFWTSATAPTATYWGFRSAEENGVGGSSDSPDGDLVEKGGAAQQLRARYFAAGVNAAAPSPSRPLYTCTQGTPVCKVNDPANPSLLSDTPFSTANAAIDAVSLNLDSRNVSPLTAKVTKSITALRDTREVSITNAGASTPVTALTTNSITGTVTLNNSSVANISAMSNNATTTSGVSCQSTGTNGTARVVYSGNHGLAGGTTINVVVPTDSGSKYNVTSKAITYENATSFTYTASGLNASAGTLPCDVTSSNTSVLVTTSAAHGFVQGQSVTIAGASPTAFNGLKTITAVGSATSFTYAHTVGSSPTISSATATGASSTVKATKTSGTFAAGTFSAGQQVTISGETSGSTPSYNGTFTILSTPAPTTTTFYFSTGTTNTTAATGTITAGQSGLTATATVAGHAFIAGDVVSINGASPNGFNGSKTITSVVPGVSFSYDVTAGLGTATANPAITVSQATISTVTATLANHKFVVGDFVTIAGVTGDTSHNASWEVASVPDTSTFTYSTVAALGAPGGTPTVRLTTSPKAYATITGHGYGANDSTFTGLTVTGATPAGYNVSSVTGTVEDANTISYVLTGALGTNTGLTVSALTPGLTAKATSTAHGFSGTPTVTIAGASPSAFNGPYTITVTGLDTFEYTLGTAQNDASGTITATASGGSSSERDNVINWIRGEDNFQDENSNSSFSDTRASMHGDVLHSRPSVVNYNRRSTDTANIDNDVYIFYGGNDGVFRAVKGGFGSSTTTTFPALSANDPLPGEEVWGFVAKDHFANLRRLRINSPGISSAFKKPYFFDGPIGAYTKDANGDGMLDPNNARAANGTVTAATTGDKVWLFLTMRRGGRAIYALDVSVPTTPKMLWRRGCPSYSTVAAEIDATTGCDLGFSELGQTWSEPRVVQVVCSTTPCPSSGDPVLIFGAGYDPSVEDLDPATITSSTATAVVSAGTTYTRSMGRGIFVLNAATGALIFHASNKAAASVSMPTGAVYKQVSGMDYSIASDIAVVVGDPTPKPFRAYVGDTGGQLWRFDFGDLSPSNWTLLKLASIADHTTTALVGGVNVIPGMRKFQFAPDVIGGTGFDMVLIGSGDREHPFDSIVVNRVYGFKDKSQTTTPPSQTTITHSTSVTFNGSSIKSLLDVSTQCIEKPASCSGSAPEIAVGGTSASQNTSDALSNSTNTGWFITLAAGEKQVGSTLASGSGVVQFGTNQPSASAGGGACSPNLGVARQYAVNYLDGTAFNGTALSTQYVGGGFLPSPVLVFVGLGGATGTGTTSTAGVGVGGNITSGSSQLGFGAGCSTGGTGNVASAVVCYGASCSLAPGSVLFSRLRKFWYKEID
jgi:Tfp pilus tip-associated adhesin PilY1